MPVVVKRDSLEVMGPVVGEELLEAAAEAAKENAASIIESAAAAGNSNSSPSSAAGAARGGGEVVVEGVGESDFGMMTEIRDLDCSPTSAGLDNGLAGGWTVWSYDD